MYSCIPVSYHQVVAEHDTEAGGGTSTACDEPVGWLFQRKDENHQLQILNEFNRGSKKGLRCTIASAGDKELCLHLLGDPCRLQPRVASWGPAQDSHFWSVGKPSFDII